MPFYKGHPGYTPKQTPEHVEKRVSRQRGKKLSKEHRLKMSKARLGKTPWNKGIKNPFVITEEHRRKLSESKRGAKCYLWKGGITPLNAQIRKSLDYKLWREAVFKRDDYRCQWCGKRGVWLVADHIKPFWKFPKLRFILKNGRTLCKTCDRIRTTKQIKAYYKHLIPSHNTIHSEDICLIRCGTG